MHKYSNDSLDSAKQLALSVWLNAGHLSKLQRDRKSDSIKLNMKYICFFKYWAKYKKNEITPPNCIHYKPVAKPPSPLDKQQTVIKTAAKNSFMLFYYDFSEILLVILFILHVYWNVK